MSDCTTRVHFMQFLKIYMHKPAAIFKDAKFNALLLLRTQLQISLPISANTI